MAVYTFFILSFIEWKFPSIQSDQTKEFDFFSVDLNIQNFTPEMFPFSFLLLIHFHSSHNIMPYKQSGNWLKIKIQSVETSL